MHRKILLGCGTAAILLTAMPADAAKRRAKARPAVSAVASADAKALTAFGTLAKLEGSTWQNPGSGRLATVRWLQRGSALVIEHDLPTGSREETTVRMDAGTGDLLFAHKDLAGKERSTTARRLDDGSIAENETRDGAPFRTIWRLTGPDGLALETSALVGAVWSPGERQELRRVSAGEAEQLRSVGRQAMLKRWGALAGLGGRSFRMDLKGREYVRTFRWDVLGEILIERETITGLDPARYATTTLYRYDAANNRIASSTQTGSAQPLGGTATVESDGTIVYRLDKTPTKAAYVRLLGPNFYEIESGRVDKKGFKSEAKLTYAVDTPVTLAARAAKLAPAIEPMRMARAGAVPSAMALTAVPGAAPEAEPKKKGGGFLKGLLQVGGALAGSGALGNLGGLGGGGGAGGLLNALSGAGGGGDAAALAAMLGGSAGGSDPMSAAILAQTLGAGSGGGGAGGLLGGLLGAGGGGGGAAGLLGGLMGGGGGGGTLGAVGALAGMLGGGNSQSTGALQMMFAALKAEDPGALIQSIAMLDAAGKKGEAAKQAVAQASVSSKGSVRPGSYATQPNLLEGSPACRGYTLGNWKQLHASAAGSPKAAQHTACAAAFNYYSMYRNAVAQGYSEADANRTYTVYQRAATQAAQGSL